MQITYISHLQVIKSRRRPKKDTNLLPFSFAARPASNPPIFRPGEAIEAAPHRRPGAASKPTSRELIRIVAARVISAGLLLETETTVVAPTTWSSVLP